jgi:hypothetical protein
MSDIQRRIVTLFEARGAGQMRASLGQMRSDMSGYRRELRDVRHEAGLVDKQLRAIGTTARYALGGAAIFGGIGMVQQLNQVQQQLGLISAISPSAFGGVRLAGDQLERFGEQAEDAALRANVPVTEFNEGLVNLVSSVQNVPDNEIVPMLELISQTAKLSQTPVDEATRGVLGLAVAFKGVEGVNLKNITQYLAEYQKMINEVPGGPAAGPQIIGQLPQLAAVSLQSNVSAPQMFGLLQANLRAGGNPATTARGLQYLIQGLGAPPSAQSKKALAGIGITPQMVQDEGGVAALFKLIQAVKTAGFGGASNQSIKNSLIGLTDEQLAMMDTGEGGGLGITGAGAELARLAVGRIHGVRSLILLAAQDEQVLKDLQAQVDLSKNHAQQVQQLRENWQAFEDTAQLQKVGLAVNAMALDIAQVFEPILNWSGGGLTRLQKVVDAHPEAAVGALVGGAGLFALNRRRRMGGLLRGLGPAHAAYSTAVNLGQETERGATPTNPVFVAIAYSLSGWNRPNASPVPVGTGGGPDPVKGGGRWGKAGNLAKKSTGLVLPFALAYELNTMFGNPITGGFGGGSPNAGFNQIKQRSKQTKLFDYLNHRDKGITIPLGGLFGSPVTIGGGGRRKLSAQQQQIMDRVEKGYLSPQNAERMLRRVSTMEQLRDAGIQVRGKAELTVKVEQPNGKQTKSKVIIDFAPDFTPSAPQQRGQRTTQRGG